MYELEQINPKISKKYFNVMAKVTKTKDPYILLTSIMRDTFYHLIPTQANYFVKNYIKRTLEPLKLQIELNYKIRSFKSQKERLEVFKILEERFDYKIFETEIEKKEFEDIMDTFYDLLDYDLYEEESGEVFLYSLNHIFSLAKKHIKALEELIEQNKNKPPESNYDIATNTNDTKEKMVAFKLNYLNNELANPLLSEKLTLEYEYQKDTLLDFITCNHLTVRSIRELKKIRNDFPNDSFIKSKTDLLHTLNSDKPIDAIEIYRSFFTCVFGVYAFTSRTNKKKIPYSKLYIFASQLSELFFPELKKLKKPLFVKEKTKKPIRETSIYNGLSLISFEDGRYKIKKEQDEIKFTEEYLETIIHFSQRYLHLSKS